MIYVKNVDRSLLSLGVVERATKLFERLGWAIEPEFDDEDSLFDRFCALLSRLSDDERDLILLLTEDFLHCVMHVQDRAVRIATRRLTGYECASKVIAVPLIKDSDVGSVKSGSMAAYLFRAEFGPRADEAGIAFHHHDRPELVSQYHAGRENALIVMVDDFIGSGRTANTAIEEFRRQYSVPSDRIVVLTLVGQKLAVEEVRRNGVEVFVGIERERGIADSVRIADADKEAATETMRALSRRIGVSRDGRLGFGKAEALVSLQRCPNNTFPCYWRREKVQGTPWPGPFRR
jgi:hypothetical protein